ncbi:hypothetical protein L596_015297 [Steinernema carpocapsae]|uniref:Uncharacterized protein n=1 Tax=Steinernema carpocapsae TaxID=34508 RepID=A0A4U5NEK8_STECR|nr:hypothetical protein L596_015297 [Steinernema carpocapsae]
MTTSWTTKETPATLAPPTEEATSAVQRAMGFVPEHKDKIEKWSETYSRKPGWMKINQKNTWYKEEPRADQGRPAKRRYPELLAEGANRKVDKLRKQRQGLIITEGEKTNVNQVLASPNELNVSLSSKTRQIFEQLSSMSSGLSIKLPASGARGALNRSYEPPAPKNLLLPSTSCSQEVPRELG